MRNYVLALSIVLLCILFAGCAEDVPDPLTQEDLNIVDLPQKVVNVSVSEGQEVARDATITVKFNKKMASANIEVSGVSGSTVLDPTGKSATFTPLSDMSSGAHVLKVTGKDDFDRDLETFTRNFRVAVESPPPIKVKSINVESGQTVISNYTIVVEFDGEMAEVNIDISGVKGTTTLSRDGKTATFTPSSAMSSGSHTLTITGKDTLGRDLKPVSRNFTVESEVKPRKSVIAFSSNRDGDYEIYLMYVDGTEVTQFTKNVSNDIEPVWSPNEKELAFVSDRDSFEWIGDIFLMKSDGTQVNLTNTLAVNEDYPFWSRDGKRIGFFSDRIDNPGYYVINTDGTNLRLMNDDEWGDFVFMVDSPDGTMFVYEDDSSGDSEIYLDIYGGNTGINLTRNPASDVWPSWSPDSKSIVFASDRDGNFEIYIMSIDNRKPIRITYNPADDVFPAWSPF